MHNLTIGIKAKVTSLILDGQLLRDRFLWIAQSSRGGGQVGGSQFPRVEFLERQLLTCGTNCLMVKVKWTELQSNRWAWAITFLSKKS